MPVYKIDYFSKDGKLDSFHLFAKSLRGAASKVSRLSIPPLVTCVFVCDPDSTTKKKRYYEESRFLSPWLDAKEF